MEIGLSLPPGLPGIPEIPGIRETNGIGPMAVPGGDRYMHFGGTSGATPIVAGICALMLSVNPDLTSREVKQILKDTADKVGSPSEYVNGHSLRFGYGRVNADRAVAEAIRRKSQGSGTSTPW
ncbi:MAG: S8 family serine peptidase [Saprospirales bacterium]|nr:S8 family serine peptidase [Saprospirales bacterium]